MYHRKFNDQDESACHLKNALLNWFPHTYILSGDNTDQNGVQYPILGA